MTDKPMEVVDLDRGLLLRGAGPPPHIMVYDLATGDALYCMPASLLPPPDFTPPRFKPFPIVPVPGKFYDYEGRIRSDDDC